MNVATTGEETAAHEAKTTENQNGNGNGNGERLYAGKFKSAEELENGYIEAQKAITERGRKANLAESLAQRVAQEQGISEESALDYLAGLSKGEMRDLQARTKAQPTEQPTVKAAPAAASSAETTAFNDPVARAEARRARWEMKQDKLLATHPEASSVLDQIELEFMQTGEPPEKIFEKRFLPLIEKGKQNALESVAKKNAAGVTVGAGIIPAPNKEDELRAYAERTGDWKPLIKHRRTGQ